MSNNRELIASVDIGSNKVACAVAYIKQNRDLDIIGLGSATSTGVRKGTIVNIEDTVASIKKAVIEAELISGCHVETVYVSISGSHIESVSNFSSSNIRGYISTKDIINAKNEASKVKNLPPDKKIIHTLLKGYEVDKEKGIKDPTGMSGSRLETKLQIITASNASCQNIVKCINQCGLDVNEVVYGALASSEAVLTEDEKDLGVALIDMGEGVNDLVIFKDGCIVYTGSVLFGGSYITKDISSCLKTPYLEAEKLKKEAGSAWTKYINKNEYVLVSAVGGRPASKKLKIELVEIIEARVRETTKLLWDLILKSEFAKKIPSGIVITGGSSLLPYLDDYCEYLLDIPVRVAKPTLSRGIKTIINSPLYSTAVGLLIYGSKSLDGGSTTNTTNFISSNNWFSRTYRSYKDILSMY